jgi:DNA-binding GntR family transcriptional regulator
LHYRDLIKQDPGDVKTPTEIIAASAAGPKEGTEQGERVFSSVDRVHQALRERILSGQYAPGSRLILTRLSREHGLSLIPIREALQRLEAERLVVTEPNRGARVAEISIADMRDIYETRVVLEQHAIREAIPRMDADALGRADRALTEMEERFEAGDERAAFAAHERFHFTLYESAGSSWTMHVIRQLWASAGRYLRLAASVRPAPAEFVAEHRAIYEAVAAGDIDVAVERLTENLRTTERLLTETYQGMPHRLD